MLKAPFPWFGGKSTVAQSVWRRFGDVQNYVEPFAGSAAMLLCRPQPFRGPETINDADGYVANFWRAISQDAQAVAQYADWPVNENDQHARHIWLVGQRDSMVSRLEGDPDWCDAKIAGWWVWGMAIWIGSGFCEGQGPWRVVDGELVKGNAGRGVQRKRPHLATGRGVQRRRPHLATQGVQRRTIDICHWFAELKERLRCVRVCCGDWSRVLTPTVTTIHGRTIWYSPRCVDQSQGSLF